MCFGPQSLVVSVESTAGQICFLQDPGRGIKTRVLKLLTSCLPLLGTDLVLGAFSSAVTEYKAMQTQEKHEARATPELTPM